MKYVTCMGGLWKLQDHKFKEFAAAHAANGEADLDDYGTHLGQITANVTDWTKWEAEEHAK